MSSRTMFVLLVSWLLGCAIALQFTDYPHTGQHTIINLEGTNTFIYQIKGHVKSWCGSSFESFRVTDTKAAFVTIYEGFSGVKSAIQIFKVTSGYTEEYITKTDATDLKCNLYKGFWVQWGDGTVQMGTGIEPGVNILWNRSAPVILTNDIKLVRLGTGSVHYKVATPYNSRPQIITSPNQVQWSDTDKAGLIDRNSDVCLSVITATNLKVKVSQVFSPHLANEFDVKVVTVDMDCSDGSFMVSVPLTQGSQPFEGSFQLCEFVRQEAVSGGKQSCEFKCQCSCDSFHLQIYNKGADAKLCGVYYP